jgi:hypothetical protein
VLGVSDSASSIGSSISSGVTGGVNSMMALFGAKGGGRSGPSVGAALSQWARATASTMHHAHLLRRQCYPFSAVFLGIKLLGLRSAQCAREPVLARVAVAKPTIPSPPSVQNGDNQDQSNSLGASLAAWCGAAVGLLT